jgi:hypothetical protein
VKQSAYGGRSFAMVSPILASTIVGKQDAPSVGTHP